MPVIPGRLVKLDKSVIRISDESSSSSSDDEPRIVLENPLHNVRHSEKIPNPRAAAETSTNPRRRKVVTETAKSSKRRRTDLEKYVAKRGSSSDLSSSSDEETVLPTEMRLNLRGTKEQTRKTVAELMREEEERDCLPNTEGETATGITVLRWTQEMHKFYDEVDEAAANFCMESHFEAMEYDPNDWKIGVEDKYRTSSSGSGGGRGGTRYYLGGHGQSPAGRRTSRGRCMNCNEFGHYANECAEPEKDLVCRLCAAVNDHQTDYCSDQVCLRCGSREGRYDRPCQRCLDAAGETCPQCGVRGHLSQQCPDNWRRFHDTVDPGRASEPQRPLADCHKRASEMFCVNCCRKGHHLHHCHAYQHRNTKPLSVLKVCSYECQHQVPSWMDEDLEEEGATAASGKAMSNRKKKKLLKEVKRRRKEELRDAQKEAEAAASLVNRRRKRKLSKDPRLQISVGFEEYQDRKMRNETNIIIPGIGSTNWDRMKQDQSFVIGQSQPRISPHPQGPAAKEPLTSRQKWRQSIKLQQQNVSAALKGPRAVQAFPREQKSESVMNGLDRNAKMIHRANSAEVIDDDGNLLFSRLPSWMNEDLEEEGASAASGKAMSNRKRKMERLNERAAQERRKLFGRGDWKTHQKSENRLKAEALKTEFKVRRGFGNSKKLSSSGKMPAVPPMEDVTRRQAIGHLETFLNKRMRGKAAGKGSGFLQAYEAANRLVGQLKTKTKKKLSAGLKTKVSATLKALKYH